MAQFSDKSNIVQIVETLKKGEIPSTQMIQSEIAPAKAFLYEKEKESTTMAKEQAVHETRKFLEAFEQLLVEKNLSGKMSRLVEAAKRVGENTEPANNKAMMWRETRQFVEALRDLIPDVIKSQDFRQSILDLFKVLRDILNMKSREHKGTKRLESAFIEGKPITETAQLIGNETKNVFNELKSGNIPEDQKRLVRENLNLLIKSIKAQDSTSIAFQKFLKLWDMFNTELSLQINREKVDKDVKEVEDAARDLIEAFSGRKLDSFIDKLQKANDTIQNDQTLQTFLHDFRSYLSRGIENPDLIATEAFINFGDELVQRGRDLAEQYYQSNILNDICDESQELLDAIKTDELVNNLICKAGKVADAFTYTDITGRTHLDTDLITQMRADLVPFLLNNIQNIPLPGLKIMNDEKFEYLIIEDLKVKLEDIVPDKIIIHSKNDTEISPKDFDTETTSETVIKFKMEGIRPEFHDFQFRFKRRGLIDLQDEGRANLKITGKGINVNMEFDLQIDDQKSLLINANSRVKVAVDGIQLDVIESDHKVLLNMVSTLFSPVIKQDLEDALKRRFEEMGREWAGIINKRILAAIPIGKIGSTMGEVITKNVPGLSELEIDSTTKHNPLIGTTHKTTVKQNP